MNIRIKKSTAIILMGTFLIQLFSPTVSFALTSGPSQPEMQSFEPVGTTDMVNAFSGDFVYNIPLLDVEGYPVNIAYHSGITAEEEASWVGLGWNINPGNINHAIRGLPDDFNGETIQKEIKINDEVRKRFGMFFGFEVAGIKFDKAVSAIAKALRVNVGGSLSMGVDISNYTGVSASLGLGTDVGIKNDWMSAGVNMGATFTSDHGVDIDKSMSASVSGSKSSKDLTASITGSFGQGYNSREGLKYTSFGVNPSLSTSKIWQKKSADGPQSKSIKGVPKGLNNSVVPISLQNFVPVITNASYMESNYFQFKMGIEATATIYPNFGGSFGQDIVRFQQDGSRKAYGFFNLQNAGKNDITDFTRDKDGRFSRDMQYLPPGNLTYDIYSVNGQGTAGMFRGFRNDIGTVYDPYTNSDNESNNDYVELGVGNIFEAGWDNSGSYSSSSSGPWNKYRNSFSKKKTGSIYEPHYFKQAGELTESSSDFNTAIKGSRPLTTAEMGTLPASPLEASNIPEARVRGKRSNLLYYFTGDEARYDGVSLQPNIQNYTTPGSYGHSDISRVGGNRRPNLASEYTQVLPDGRRYIYGIPAMNNQQVEYVVSCNGPGNSDGTVDISSQGLAPYGTATAGSSDFGQKFYMKTSTPSYAHSYLLSDILSPDYVDLTGNGISDDDIGSYTKFNYTLKDPNYTWRTPYETGKAQYDEGVSSDCHDDKATFMVGSKEIWMLHSIETKNYVAEFYTSQRDDGKGSGDNAALSGASVSSNYKLDKIVLYNRKERLANPTGAIPIKTVEFTYDYSLCKGIPNSSSPNSSSIGKLTLKAISIKYGNSDAGYLSPYRFTYSSFNPNYNAGTKDFWGNYKDNSANSPLSLSNHQFPYVKQNLSDANQNASAWNLTKVKLPSGGSIEVSYESDDYAYVQNKRAMEMYKVEGVGPDKEFQAGNSLYQSQTNPYLYVYFNRKKTGSAFNEWYNDARKSYLDNGDLVQFNFKVKMSSNDETTPSCGIPLDDHIKGYAGVEAGVEGIGNCSDGIHGYIKLSPKNVEKMPGLAKVGVSNISLNPVTLAAIFYARYYNSKALYPSSEIVSISSTGALIKQLISSFADIADFFRSPIAKYLNQGRAKYVDLDQSFIRLCSQGKKLGGGHRVKRIEFKDNWDEVSNSTMPVASYGSDYDYTMIDDASGQRISSGVASYEPILGGDENPFREPIATDRLGYKKDFPVIIPTELTVEGPIGETMYPSPNVGYSKVTVTSIHKADGASSQTIQEHEFYTARDFPVRTENTELETLEDRKIKALDFSFDKKEAYRVGQGYSMFFNDMHGKPKRESTYLAQGSAGKPALVSYKSYEYYTNRDGTLNNNVPCMSFDANGNIQQGTKTLGVETDIMLDSREKLEKTHTSGFMANLNIFMIGIFPIPIPTAFPKFPKSIEKAFSSAVSTKVTQQYGILKSVESFDKGATVKMSNELYDPNTGQVLVTKVNTEHNDYEMQVKYPAYWAYRCMGPAYENILYDEHLSNNKAALVNDTCYFASDHPERYNVGDELLFTVNQSCWNPAASETYKLWVVAKNAQSPGVPIGSGSCLCPMSQKGCGYNTSGQPLADGVPDPNYLCSIDGGLTWSSAYTFYHAWNLTNTYGSGYVPWITSPRTTTGTAWFKTTINVTSYNINWIQLRLGIDAIDDGGCTACPKHYSSYSVNGVDYPIPALGVNHHTSYFTPQGLVNGTNTIIIKFCDCSAPLGMSASFLNCPAPQNAIAALPIKRNALSVDGASRTFPSNGKIDDAAVKIIRSGKRNQLQDDVQQVTTVNRTGTFNYASGLANIIGTSAKTFTDEAAASDVIANQSSVYFNPYVTGRKGNFRPLATYGYNDARSYSASIDPGKGLLNSVTSFYWSANLISSEYYSYLFPVSLMSYFLSNSKWTSQAQVQMYSPLGNDLEVHDAAGNVQSNLFGYSNSLPIATVKNSEWDDALSENFEDNAEPSSILAFFQNNLHKYLKQTGIPVSFSTAHHTGSYALNVSSTANITFPIGTGAFSSYPAGSIYPFHFRAGKKYVISYWQQASQNSANLTAPGSLSLTIGSTGYSIFPKTPVIDGWVLYEGVITIPGSPSSGTATISLAASVLDDIRIMPAQSNMKSYVYNPITHKLVAMLDENHMASFFEYDVEGKLVRIKKETEKGVLTLKESRASVHSAINSSTGNGTLDLKN